MRGKRNSESVGVPDRLRDISIIRRMRWQWFVLFSLMFGTTSALECLNGAKVIKRTNNALNSMEEVCGCLSLWEGERCQTPWINDTEWLFCFRTYHITVCFIFLTLAFWCCREIIAVVRTSEDFRIYSVATYCLSLGLLGCLIRIFAFAVDPHGAYDIITREKKLGLFITLYAGPVISWISAGYGVCLYWMEVCRYQEFDKDSRFVKKLRPTLYGLVIACWIVLGYVTIMPASAGNTTADIVRYTCSTIFTLGFLIVSMVYGTSLRSQLSGLNLLQAKILRRRISVYMTLLPIVFIIICVCHISFIKGYAYEKYSFLYVHCINRVAEFLLVLNWVLLFRRSDAGRKEKETDTRSSDSILGDSQNSKKAIRRRKKRNTNQQTRGIGDLRIE
ncbi:hypothetical protein PROFUN_03382 [Planoprotostelium fungivorum]|uniref:Uncharacterized protein n=1 Tax=Planoprotostelium fungivorum TaxID=1890364 RepID=A0A2P6NWD6_9EUKA|nr:hypothetical protein PROFUN_03382 [Planoprotostelium fungivorum]